MLLWIHHSGCYISDQSNTHLNAVHASIVSNIVYDIILTLASVLFLYNIRDHTKIIILFNRITENQWMKLNDSKIFKKKT